MAAWTGVHQNKRCIIVKKNARDYRRERLPYSEGQALFLAGGTRLRPSGLILLVDGPRVPHEFLKGTWGRGFVGLFGKRDPGRLIDCRA